MCKQTKHIKTIQTKHMHTTTKPPLTKNGVKKNPNTTNKTHHKTTENTNHNKNNKAKAQGQTKIIKTTHTKNKQQTTTK